MLNTTPFNPFPPSTAQLNASGGSSGAVAAEDVTYDNTDSGLTADNVQSAIDEVSAAENISYDNTDSGLTADDVQAAIDEVNTTAQKAILSFTSGEKDTGLTWRNNKRLYRQTVAVTINDLVKSAFTDARTTGAITSVIPATADEVFIDGSHSAVIFDVDANVLKSIPVEYIGSDGKYVRTQILNDSGWQIYFDATFASALLYDNASDITLIVTVFYTKSA